MKVKKYTQQELEHKLEMLHSFKGTKHEKASDKRYIRAYTEQLNNLKSSS